MSEGTRVVVDRRRKGFIRLGVVVEGASYWVDVAISDVKVFDDIRLRLVESVEASHNVVLARAVANWLVSSTQLGAVGTLSETFVPDR